MKQKSLILIVLIVTQSMPILAMKREAEGNPKPQSSSLDVLPPELLALLLPYISGDSLDSALDGIKLFYNASPRSAYSVVTNKAILSYIIDRFRDKPALKNGAEFQKNIIDQLKQYPLFRQGPLVKQSPQQEEMLIWITQQKERLDKEESLRQAASAGDVKRVQELIEEGVNINTRNGRTPLILAIEKDHPEVIKMLVANGANVNLARSGDNMTPLMEVVIFTEDSDVVKFLIDSGARVNDTDNIGSTALNFVLYDNDNPTENTKNIVKLLLDAGANVNIMGADKATVLSRLIKYYHGTQIQDEILTMLLAKGANPNLGIIGANWIERSQLQYAREVLHNEDLARRLIRYGAIEAPAAEPMQTE